MGKKLKKVKKTKKTKVKLAFGAASVIGIGIALAGLSVSRLVDTVETSEGTKSIVPDSGVADVAGASKTSMESAMDQAGSADDIVCEKGRASNFPDRVYCYDGRTAGFLLSEGDAAVLLSEIEAEIPSGIVADRVIIRRSGVSMKAHVSGYKENK